METKETIYGNWINCYPSNSSNTIILPIYLHYISCYTTLPVIINFIISYFS